MQLLRDAAMARRLCTEGLLQLRWFGCVGTPAFERLSSESCLQYDCAPAFTL